jgi:hypothetical protein
MTRIVSRESCDRIGGQPHVVLLRIAQALKQVDHSFRLAPADVAASRDPCENMDTRPRAPDGYELF